MILRIETRVPRVRMKVLFVLNT